MMRPPNLKRWNSVARCICSKRTLMKPLCRRLSGAATQSRGCDGLLNQRFPHLGSLGSGRLVRYSHFLASISRRDMASLEERLIRAVSSVQDPIVNNTDLRSLGWTPKRVKITSDGNVEIQLILPTLMHPKLQELRDRIRERAMEELSVFLKDRDESGDMLPSISILISASPPYPVVARRVEEHSEILSKLGPGLANVAHFVAVYSCKGGVGKSTVAVNLAYELARMGGRVGLLDVDIYGPSLPVLVRPEDASVRRSPIGKGMVLPIEHEGVKLLSLGFVSPESGVPGSGPDGGAAVMRGPMAGRVVTQLLKGTDWGGLDTLILDLPPGTGDVQLTVCQDLDISGAVAVTTPSKLAVADAKKGIEMFTSLGVPTIALVENMSYFVCDGGGVHYPFGQGIHNKDFRTPHVFKLPISITTNDANDEGSPLCLSRPSSASDELNVFQELASSVAQQLLLLQHGRSPIDGSSGLSSPCMVAISGSSERFDIATVGLSVRASQDGFAVRMFSNGGATQVNVAPMDLRVRHPKTGELLSETDQGTEGEKSDGGMIQHHRHNDRPGLKLMPAKVEKKGRYGYAVEWADGATIIYSMLSIAKAAGGTVVQ